MTKRIRRYGGSIGASLALAALLSSPATSEIFRYQDADGNWQFTDRPPPDHRFAPVPEPYAEGSKHTDIAARLQEQFQPRTAIERATLAVVGIEHGAGGASGFFIRADGYLLTNRHVVRPAESAPWQETTQRLTDEAAELDELLAQAKDEAKDMERQLAALAEDLARARAGVADLAPGQAEIAAAQVQRLSETYGFRKARLDDARAALTKRERDLRRQRQEHSWQGAASSVQTNFKITLKDGTDLTAVLLGTSDKLDLALLKVDGQTTPALVPAAERWLGQGESVFAVGSPLGMGDALTPGVITALRDGQIVTDAQILPGNSGGPLLNQNGEVIGVNVARLSADDSPLNQGSGMAIPIAAAIGEFPELGFAPVGP